VLRAGRGLTPNGDERCFDLASHDAQRQVSVERVKASLHAILSTERASLC
jgi:hypothetical protein